MYVHVHRFVPLLSHYLAATRIHILMLLLSQVSFHGERGEYVGEQFSVRLQREAPVSELLAEVAQRLQRAAAERAAARQQQQQAGSGTGQQEGSSQGGAAGAAAAPGGDKAAQQAADDAALAVGAAAAAAGRPMRLLEVTQSKIFKVGHGAGAG